MTGFIETYLWLLGPILVRYVVIAAAVHTYFWNGRFTPKGVRLAAHPPKAEHLWREGRTAFLASVIYALPAAILIHRFLEGGTALSAGMPEGVWEWLWIPGAVVLLLLLHDAYFYWTHRAMHHPRLYAATHRTHHVSKQPTAFASFAFHPWEAAIAAWFIPALAFVIPMHIGAFIAFVSIATVWAVTNHAGWEIFPRSFLEGPVGRWLITARHHNLHHTRFRRNYGLYFRFWDKAMGTDDMSGDPMAAASMPEAVR